jgi:hypothetical protein
VVAQDAAPRDLSLSQSTAWAAGASNPGSLKVSINADRADATYAIGETARLYINANEDAYVTVLSVGPTGQVHMLFPNAYQRDNHVSANRSVEIAGGVSGAHIAVSGPAGTELIKVVASSKPLTVVAENQLRGNDTFRSLEGGVDTLMRNLNVISNTTDNKVAIQNYTLRTVPNRSSDLGQGGTLVLVPAQPAPPATTIPALVPVVTTPAATLISVPAQQPFPLLLALDKPAYKVGERVTLGVTTLQACHLTVVEVTTAGAIRVLFPNQNTQNNAIAANQTVLVAGGSSNLALQVVGPAGTEQIVAVCSTDQTPVLTHKIDLAQLFPPAGERIDVARDLSVAANRPVGTTAMASVAFTVQP